MIQFKEIRWKNFLSTGNAFNEISLTDTPTTLILGVNGSGKSTLLDALCFALFGRAYREINKPQLVNSVNGKKCEVQIEFTIGKKEYKIVRGIKPTLFEIYVDGELINQDAASRDYQKYLEESILKLNFKSFTQIVILGSAGFTPFMQLPAASRRAIIEDILDIQIFSIMNVLLKAKVKDAIDIHGQLSRDLELEKHKALNQESLIKSLQENKQSQIDELTRQDGESQKQIRLLTKKIAQDKVNLSTLSTQLAEFNRQEKMYDEQDALKKAAERQLRIRGLQVKAFEETQKCDVCGQTIAKEFKKQHLKELENELSVLETNIDEIVTRMDNCEQYINYASGISDKYDIQQKEIWDAESALKTHQQLVQLYRKQIQDLESKQGDVKAEKAKLKEMAIRAIAISKRRQNIGEEKFYFEFASTLLKDSGIKTQIINQYLPVINKLVNKYLAEMDFFVQFTLDDEFKEIIRSRFRDEFTYASFSEGEKQRIDLALLFTWRTVAKMKNSASTNLLILDEVFDSSLDTSGTEYVMQLINTLSTDSHVFVISHKPELMADKFKRIIQFELRQNFSVLTEES